MKPLASHPTPDRLQDFSLGRLNEAESGVIERHLVDCAECCHTLEELDAAPDEFLSRLKDSFPPLPAHDAETVKQTSDQAIAPIESRTSQSTGEDAPLTLPPELCNHPRYEVLGPIASGGMGVVFKARHRLLDRLVVLKVIRSDLSHRPDLLQRFDREARLSAKLSHPHIVTVFEAEPLGDSILLVMEFLHGQSLAELVRKKGPLPVAVACELVRQAALGLQHIHEQGLVHRDVKPSNLMLTATGQVKLLDLGLAFLKTDEPGGFHAPDRDLSRSQQMMGTVDYMAPEQWEDSHGVDIRADIYSLGCTLYCLLTGEAPYEASEEPNVVRQIWAHTSAPIPSIREKRADVPEGVEEIVRRMIAKKPADRYRVPAEVATALEPYAVGGDAASYLGSGVVRFDQLRSGSSVWPDSDSRTVRRRWLGAMGIAALVASFVGLVYFQDRLTTDQQGSSPASGLPPAALTGAPPIMVGILHSLTGTMASSETPVVDATLLAVEEINESGGLLGRRIEAVIENGASDPATFARAAEKLITVDGVSTVFGCWTSASRKTVKPIFERHEHLLFYPVQYEGLEQSPNIVYTGAAPNQQILPAVKWCCSFLKKERLFLVGSDYVFPRCAAAIIRDQAAELGGEVVGEEYLSLGSQDAANVVQKILEAEPDIILNTINGDSNLAFIRALRTAGITPDVIPTMSFSIAEHELASLSDQNVVGDYAAWNYFMSIEGRANSEFVRRFHARYGAHRVLTDPMEAAYFGVHLWAQAVRAAGSDDAAAIRDAAKGQSWQAPNGLVEIDPSTQHTAKTVRIGQIVNGPRFEILYTSDKPVLPVPYPATRTRAQWEEFLEDLHLGWGGRWSSPTGH